MFGKTIPGILYVGQNHIWDLVVKICKTKCFPSKIIISEIIIRVFSVVFKLWLRHHLSHDLTNDPIVALTLGCEPNSYVGHTFSLCFIFLPSFIEYASYVLK